MNEMIMPEGTTHFDIEYNEPYRVDEGDVFYWWRGKWFFFCYVSSLDNLGIELSPI